MALHFTPGSQCFIHEFNFIKFIDDTGENEEKQQVQYQLLLIKKQNYLHFLEIHEWLVNNRFQILNWFHNMHRDSTKADGVDEKIKMESSR